MSQKNAQVNKQKVATVKPKHEEIPMYEQLPSGNTAMRKDESMKRPAAQKSKSGNTK